MARNRFKRRRRRRFWKVLYHPAALSLQSPALFSHAVRRLFLVRPPPSSFPSGARSASLACPHKSPPRPSGRPRLPLLGLLCVRAPQRAPPPVPAARDSSSRRCCKGRSAPHDGRLSQSSRVSSFTSTLAWGSHGPPGSPRGSQNNSKTTTKQLQNN